MDKVIAQFTTRAQTYSASANWIADQSLIRAHIEAAESKRGGSVLEVCCGTGMVGRSFRADGWQINGVDLTRGMAEEANRYFPCICTPAENIPFLDRSFDVVVLRQAYFLLDEGQKVLAEVSRVLKDDGIFILSQTVPFSAEDSPWLEHIHRTKQFQLREFFTAETLEAELEKQYFSVAATRRLAVRENISRWMAAAPELSPEKQSEVCSLIANAPEPYRSIHQVEVEGDQVFEDWNWTIFTARKK
ncbi:MAG TPA: class I SAM-dependent methyltransferase [Geobacteraceae bacterium]|nr:class I SAM-dependent methyltransferase [Geobacteraceae bacterium]